MIGRIPELPVDASSRVREAPDAGDPSPAPSKRPVDPASSHRDVPDGRTILGRYRIERRIGSGGFATVYRATQLSVGRPVAIKMMKSVPAGSLSSPEAERDLERRIRARFEREAMLMGRLSAPTTVTVHDFGATEDGVLFMVLELIEGQTLEQVLTQVHQLPPVRVRVVLEQVLLSLREAHRLGVLHRDLKPSNVMLHIHQGVPDRVKVLDFGIARIWEDEEQEDLTQTGLVAGTPRYMAPEAIRSEACPQSDLYAVGLIAWQALCGRRPAEGKSSGAAMAEQLNNVDFQVSESECPDPGLRRVVNGLLRKTLARRIGSAEEALELLQDTQPIDVTREVSAADLIEELVDIAHTHNYTQANDGGSGEMGGLGSTPAFPPPPVPAHAEHTPSDEATLQTPSPRLLPPAAFRESLHITARNAAVIVDEAAAFDALSQTTPAPLRDVADLTLSLDLSQERPVTADTGVVQAPPRRSWPTALGIIAVVALLTAGVLRWQPGPLATLTNTPEAAQTAETNTSPDPAASLPATSPPAAPLSATHEPANADGAPPAAAIEDATRWASLHASAIAHTAAQHAGTTARTSANHQEAAPPSTRQHAATEPRPDRPPRASSRRTAGDPAPNGVDPRILELERQGGIQRTVQEVDGPLFR